MSDSYPTIRNRILDRIPDDDDIREGSPIAIAIDPVAYELANYTLIELENAIRQSNFATADREWLEKHAAAFNIFPNQPTPSQAEGQFDIPISIGERFSIDSLIFKVIEANPSKSDGYFYYTLECETPGTIGNVPSGRLVPVQVIPGLKHAMLLRILINGEDVEDDESLRARLKAIFNQVAYGGNVASYFTWVNAIPGVGRLKVLPCENPEGVRQKSYVTLVITDSNNGKPTEELIGQVQEEIDPIDPPDLKSCGLGLAPIGADVYVIGVKEKIVNFSFELTLEGKSNEQVKEPVKQEIEKFVKDQNANWGDLALTSKSYHPKTDAIVTLRASALISALLAVEGVVDVKNVTINDSPDNLTLNWDEIAKVGTINGE